MKMTDRALEMKKNKTINVPIFPSQRGQWLTITVAFISNPHFFYITEEPLNGEHLHKAIMRRDLELINKIVESG